MRLHVGVAAVEELLGPLDRERRAVDGPDVAFETRERVALLNRAMASCTERDREFARLYFAEGLPPVDVAARTGVQVATVYSRRVKLERRLTDLLSAA